MFRSDKPIITRGIATIFLVGVLIAMMTILAAAQDKSAESVPAEPIVLQPPSVTEKAITIDGKPLEYTATVGYYTQRDMDQKPLGYMFYTAYVKKGEDAVARPLTFCFNGGPGSSSIYLHMLTIGPRRALLTEEGNTPGPPPRMVDNIHTWLTFTDLVFIDPVGTGFSFPHPGVDTKKFWGAWQDAESVADFMRMYITGNQRWLSPIFVAGESYGGVRGSLLAYVLHESRTIKLNLNGLIFISPAYDWQSLATSKHNPLYLSQYLPTYAATAWYHKKLPEFEKTDFDAFIQEAVTWANEDYLLALIKGDQLTEEEKRNIAEMMARYIGLDADYILRMNLRITSREFRDELLADENMRLDRLDARWETGAYELTTTLSPALNHYIRVELGYDTLKPYVVSGNVRPWGWGEPPMQDVDRPSAFSVVPYLSEIMHSNRHMKVLVTAGYYDYACPFTTVDYALDQLLLKPELQENLVRHYYHTGHMVYTPLKELGEFTTHVREFIIDAAGH